MTGDHGAARHAPPPVAPRPDGAGPSASIQAIAHVLAAVDVLVSLAERALADPVAFLGDHRAEARLVAGWLEAAAPGAATGTAVPGAATGTAAPSGPAPRRPARRRPTPGEALRDAPSLLR